MTIKFEEIKPEIITAFKKLINIHGYDFDEDFILVEGITYIKVYSKVPSSYDKLIPMIILVNRKTMVANNYPLKLLLPDIDF